LKEIAIIGATASGKSSLAIELATKYKANILSLDSLSIYKEIDIASAKPSKEILKSIPHYGIDVIYPNEPFDVTNFIEIYKKARDISKKSNTPLLIVGGSSFYLKVLLDGISPMPKLTNSQTEQLKELLKDLERAYTLLEEIDPIYMKKIAKNDRYRIEKALTIYLGSSLAPSKFFRDNPPKPIIQNDLPIYEVLRDKEELRERIKLRTKQMLEDGLIKEVDYLKSRYSIDIKPMKAIGIKETLNFLNGDITKEELEELISIHTAQLAKRQRTFNRNQFKSVVRQSYGTLKKLISNHLR